MLSSLVFGEVHAPYYNLHLEIDSECRLKNETLQQKRWNKYPLHT